MGHTASSGDGLPVESADRLPPHNRWAEQAVLGAMIRDNDAIPDVLARVRDEDFYFDHHRRIFAAARRLADAHRPVDLVTLFEALTEAGDAAEVGGAAFLAELWDAVPTAANAAHHASIVREKARLRGLARLGLELARDAHDQVGPADDLAAQFDRRLVDLGAEGGGAEGPVRVAEEADAAVHRYDEFHLGRRSRDLIPTGLARLDQVIGGLAPGQLVVVAARPSVGKSALALQLAETAARPGAGAVVFSLEMSRAENVDRLFAGGTGVPLPRLRGFSPLAPGDAAALAARRAELSRLPLWIDDRPGRTAASVAVAARRHARRHGARLVVVDYLQLLRPENPKDPRYLQVGQSSRRLKELARECGVAVLCLAQLNRQVEARDDGRPRLSDLRDSGEVEQDADMVMLLHRTNDDERAAVHPVDLIVAKNRNGPVGTVKLDYHRSLTRFAERGEDRVPTL